MKGAMKSGVQSVQLHIHFLAPYFGKEQVLSGKNILTSFSAHPHLFASTAPESCKIKIQIQIINQNQIKAAHPLFSSLLWKRPFIEIQCAQRQL